MENTRRKFVKNIMGGAAGAGAVAMLSSFRPSKMDTWMFPILQDWVLTGIPNL